MDQTWPLLGPAASRCRADPDGPTALFIVSTGIVIDHRRGVAVGEVCAWIGKADDDHRACTLRRRAPISEGIVTAEHRPSEAVPLERTRLAVVLCEHDGCVPLVSWQ